MSLYPDSDEENAIQFFESQQVPVTIKKEVKVDLSIYSNLDELQIPEAIYPDLPDLVDI